MNCQMAKIGVFQDAVTLLDHNGATTTVQLTNQIYFPLVSR